VTKRAFLGDIFSCIAASPFWPKKERCHEIAANLNSSNCAEIFISHFPGEEKSHLLRIHKAVPKSPPESDSSLVQDEVRTGPKDGLCHLLDIEDLWNLIWRLLLGAPKV
jgi:hypothetical protein